MAAIHPETALVPFIRGELTGNEKEQVARHLEQCAQCDESAQAFRSLLAELPARLDELPTPPWAPYRAELRRKLAAREEARWHWQGRGLAWASLAAGTAFAALALWLTLPAFRTTTPAVDELALEQAMDVSDVGLLRNYPVIERLDLLENYDLIAHLDELPAAQHNHAARS